MHIYIYIFILFQILFIIGYYKVLSVISWAIQQVFVVYLVYV